MLQNIFSTILNMSFTASVVFLLIIFMRWIFINRLPKKLNYALWLIVLIRLVLPISLPSVFSIFNAIPAYKATVVQASQDYSKDYNISYVTDFDSTSHQESISFPLNNPSNNTSSNSIPMKQDKSVNVKHNMLQSLLPLISWVWLFVALSFLVFCICLYYRSFRKLENAVLFKHDYLLIPCMQKLNLKRKIQVYTSDIINTPVVCGLIKVRIILPLKLIQDLKEVELKYIITHELIHIKRLDYVIKPLSTIVLCIHWFNPLMWLAFILSQKDMENSCDETVMSVFDDDIRSEYATSLINLAVNQNALLNSALLAFGESHIKSRIKSIMRFKKPSVLLSILSIFAFVIICSILLTNSKYGRFDERKYTTFLAEEKNKRFEAVVSEYYTSINPNNVGTQKIYNITSVYEEDYAAHYLVLAENYNEEGVADTVLFLIDESYNILATAPGNIPLSPCFSANIIRYMGKSIIYGNFKDKKRNPENDLVTDVQINHIHIWFDDETEISSAVSMSEGYIFIVDTLSKIKDIEVYNDNLKIQSNLNESFYTEQNITVKDSQLELASTFTNQTISPSVPSNIKLNLLNKIEAMRDMGPGVGPWRVAYYNANDERIIFYNYAHIVACDISEKNKGIYSIIETNSLNIGSYQGSVISMLYPSSDAMFCIVGAGCWETDYSDKEMNTYLLNFYDSSAQKLEANFNMANSTVEWYRNMHSSTLLLWYASIRNKETEIIWDVEKSQRLESIPNGSRLEVIDNKYIKALDIDTQYTYLNWLEKDENTVIGVPYSNEAVFGELKLTDFEIIELDLGKGTEKVLYKIE